MTTSTATRLYIAPEIALKNGTQKRLMTKERQETKSEDFITITGY